VCGITAGTNVRKEKNTGMKIEPRKTTDRGGYLMMPLRQNVPDPADDTWNLTVTRHFIVDRKSILNSMV